MIDYILRNIYRCSIVKNNLIKAFPDLNDAQIQRIYNKYYRYLSHLVKSYFINHDEKYIRSHVVFHNIDLLKNLINKYNEIFIVSGHYGNWEFAADFLAISGYDVWSIYKELSNSFFDKLVIKYRSKFGRKLINDKNIFQVFKNIDHRQRIIAFLCDQRPKIYKFQIPFLGTYVNCNDDLFRIAKLKSIPVIYIHTIVENQCKYTYIPEILAINDYENIISLYWQSLEKDINIAPEYWLWSHNRFI